MRPAVALLRADGSRNDRDPPVPATRCDLISCRTPYTHTAQTISTSPIGITPEVQIMDRPRRASSAARGATCAGEAGGLRPPDRGELHRRREAVQRRARPIYLGWRRAAR